MKVEPQFMNERDDESVVSEDNLFQWMGSDPTTTELIVALLQRTDVQLALSGCAILGAAALYKYNNRKRSRDDVDPVDIDDYRDDEESAEYNQKGDEEEDWRDKPLSEMTGEELEKRAEEKRQALKDAEEKEREEEKNVPNREAPFKEGCPESPGDLLTMSEHEARELANKLREERKERQEAKEDKGESSKNNEEEVEAENAEEVEGNVDEDDGQCQKKGTVDHIKEAAENAETDEDLEERLGDDFEVVEVGNIDDNDVFDAVDDAQ